MICQVAVYQGREVYAFTRPDDERTQAFARTVGATWAGGSDEQPPEQLDAAIIFASAGELVPQALKALAPRRHGRVRRHPHDATSRPSPTTICGGSAGSARSRTSRAATARSSSRSRRKVPVRTTVTTYPLDQAEQALADLRAGRFEGTAVILPCRPTTLQPCP